MTTMTAEETTITTKPAKLPPGLTMPSVMTRELTDLAAERDRLEAREREIARMWPALSALAGVGREEDKAAFAAADAERREVRSLHSDTARAYATRLDERRRDVAHEVMKSPAYRAATLAAIAERANNLAAQGALFNLHVDARRQGVPVGSLPANVVADCDGVARWAREAIRLDLIRTKDLPAGWLRERLEADRD